MSTNSGNSGVKNLRAMFENKASDQSTSPPSRGRSPNPSEISNHSRPVSKVRASFVAVERPSENGGAPLIGLRRASEVSSMGEIKENAIEDTEDTKSPAPAVTAKKDNTTSGSQTAPSVNDGPDEGGLGAILKGSAFVEHTPSKLSAEAKNLTEAISSGRIHEKIPRSPSKPEDKSNAAEMVKKMQAKGGIMPGPPPTTTLQTTKDAQPVKPPPTRQQINTKPVPKSPTVTRPSPRTPTSPKVNIRGGPAKIKGVMESAKEAQRARESARLNAEKTEKTQATAPKIDTSAKSTSAPESHKKEKTPVTPKAVRSPTTIKPKPPTVPGKLPAAATATTASTAAKHDAPHSPPEAERKSVAKKPTTTSSTRPPRASSSASTFPLAKKASRTSLTNGHDRPKSRVSTARPDEGFLARMMRPTASSAQKVHEKVHVSSPPKHKTVAPNKVRQPVKEKTQSQIHVETPMMVEENKENYSDLDASTLPDVAHPSPLEVVKEDPMNDHAEREPPAPEPTEPAQQVNGQAGELD